MLFTCGGVTNSARVLIVCEPKGLGYYEDALGHALLHACHELGLEAKLTETDFKPEAKELPAALVETMAAFDMTVFLARIGDQVRFIPLPDGARAIVSYALSLKAMRSPFGTAHHKPLVAIKALIESQMADAMVRITCTNGMKLAVLPTEGRTEYRTQVGRSRFDAFLCWCHDPCWPAGSRVERLCAVF